MFKRQSCSPAQDSAGRGAYGASAHIGDWLSFNSASTSRTACTRAHRCWRQQRKPVRSQFGDGTRDWFGWRLSWRLWGRWRHTSSKNAKWVILKTASHILMQNLILRWFVIGHFFIWAIPVMEILTFSFMYRLNNAISLTKRPIDGKLITFYCCLLLFVCFSLHAANLRSWKKIKISREKNIFGVIFEFHFYKIKMLIFDWSTCIGLSHVSLPFRNNFQIQNLIKFIFAKSQLKC